MPVRAVEPFIVDVIKAAVRFDLSEKIIQKLHEIRVVFPYRPCDGFFGKGFVQKNQLVTLEHRLTWGQFSRIKPMLYQYKPWKNSLPFNGL